MGFGREGTVVDLTTYGQYDLCSFKRSNWRCGSGFLGLEGEEEGFMSSLAGGFVFVSVVLVAVGVGVVSSGFRGVKAHNPTLLWQRVHCSITFSRLAKRLAGIRKRGCLDAGAGAGEAEPPANENDDRREVVREGEPNLEGALEAETEAEGGCLREEVSEVEVGGTRAQPNSEARIAASDRSTF